MNYNLISQKYVKKYMRTYGIHNEIMKSAKKGRFHAEIFVKPRSHEAEIIRNMAMLGFEIDETIGNSGVSQRFIIKWDKKETSSFFTKFFNLFAHN